MDTEGYITFEEAAELTPPYRPPFENFPYDIEILRVAAKAGALHYHRRDGVLLTRPDWVEEWGRDLKISLHRAINNMMPLFTSAGFEFPYELVEDAWRELPAGSGQRELDAAVEKGLGGLSPSHRLRRGEESKLSPSWSDPTPGEIARTVQRLLKSERIIRATIEAAFPTPSEWSFRVVWCAKHRRNPETLTRMACNTWGDWVDIFQRFNAFNGEDPTSWEAEVLRTHRDLTWKEARDMYNAALLGTLADPDTLETLWGFGIRDTPKSGRVWIDTPEEHAQRYIAEIRRQTLAHERQRETYRKKARATGRQGKYAATLKHVDACP